MDDSINILVVDDEQIVLESIKKHFRNETNYKIFTATSVEQALLILEPDNISIVLTDLMMPDIDGLEFLKKLREKNSNIIAIMITGYATINTALQAQQLGSFDYIAKPFTRDELKKVVKRAAELSSALKISGYRKIDGDKLTGGFKGIGEHSWLVREEEGTILLGVERPFLYNVGKIQNVYLPSIGDELRQGSVYFQVFSSDLKSESLLCPISGFVKEVNQYVLDSPNEALQDPYEQGWLIRLIPENFENEIKILGF